MQPSDDPLMGVEMHEIEAQSELVNACDDGESTTTTSDSDTLERPHFYFSAPGYAPPLDTSGRGTTVQANLEAHMKWKDFLEAGKEPVSLANKIRPSFGVPVTDPWSNAHHRVEKHDNTRCRDWANDIDTLLTFIGLFSAVVTGFLIEAYQWLEPDNTALSIKLSLHISAQLANVTSSAASDPTDDDFEPSLSDLRINIFWFLSLSVALMTALIGILCKQWLQEYQKDPSLPYSQMLAVRQMRLEAFKYWKVESIVSYLPLLLQIAVLLFFAGMLDLLWHTNRLVATVVTAFVASGYVFLVGTTLLPSIVFFIPKLPSCSFKSPQSWLFIRAVVYIISLFHRAHPFDGEAKDARLSTWLHLERKDLTDDIIAAHVPRALQWMEDNYSQDLRAVKDIASCISTVDPVDLTWVLGGNFKFIEPWMLRCMGSSVLCDMARFQYLTRHQSKADHATALDWVNVGLRLQCAIIEFPQPLSDAQRIVKDTFAPSVLRANAYMYHGLDIYLSVMVSESTSHSLQSQASAMVKPLLRLTFGSLVAIRDIAAYYQGRNTSTGDPEDTFTSRHGSPGRSPSTVPLDDAKFFIETLERCICLALEGHRYYSPKNRWTISRSDPDGVYPSRLILWHIITEGFLPAVGNALEIDKLTVVDWPQLSEMSLVKLMDTTIPNGAMPVFKHLAVLTLVLEDARQEMQIRMVPRWKIFVDFMRNVEELGPPGTQPLSDIGPDLGETPGFRRSLMRTHINASQPSERLQNAISGAIYIDIDERAEQAAAANEG